MKETPLSNCERNFITQSIKQNQRLDGRKNDEFRSVEINFGADWGSVLVALGETRVLAQVSCELGVPRATRPNEGIMWLNVEMGPMAATHLEAGRNSELNVQINRTLERTFKDSRCVDLESLCVTAEERVWVLRVDLNVLNHEGNLIDCCSMATLCALAHFKRPDVSVLDDNVVIHTAAEKEPIPMVLHHYPVCVSYCTFDEGRIAVADPSASEERTAESSMVFGLNSFQELCCLNLGGTTLTSSTLLLQCAQRAAKHTKLVVSQIKEALANDSEAREAATTNIGFTECLRQNKITGLAENRLTLKLRHFNFKDLNEEGLKTEQQMDQDMTETTELSENVKDEQKTKKTNTKKTFAKWVPDQDEDGDDEDDNIVNIESDNATIDDEEDDDNGKSLAQSVEHALLASEERPKDGKRLLKKKNLQQNINGSDSEEDEKVVL